MHFIFSRLKAKSVTFSQDFYLYSPQSGPLCNKGFCLIAFPDSFYKISFLLSLLFHITYITKCVSSRLNNGELLRKERDKLLFPNYREITKFCTVGFVIISLQAACHM